MHLKRFFAGLFALAVAQVGALAIAAPPANISYTVGICDPWFPNRCSQAGPFVPDATSTTSLAITSSSLNVALPGTGQTVVVWNTGSVDAYVKLGTSSGVTATTTDFFVKAGTSVAMARQTATYLAGITGSSTSTLVVVTGNGTVGSGGGGGGGSSGGGAVTIANGADTAEGNTGDVAWVSGSGTEIALLKAIAGAAISTAASSVKIDQTTPGTTNGVQLTAGTAIAGKVGIDQTTDGTTNAVHLVAGTAIAGKVGIDQTTPGTTNGVVVQALATGGATAYGLQSAASTNSTNVKNAAGTLYGLNIINTTTTIYYLRMYDSASAPTCSSATNFSRTWPVPPAAASGQAGGVAAKLPEMGVVFANGISFCLTGGPSSTDNTNAATGVFINLDYK